MAAEYPLFPACARKCTPVPYSLAPRAERFWGPFFSMVEWWDNYNLWIIDSGLGNKTELGMWLNERTETVMCEALGLILSTL